MFDGPLYIDPVRLIILEMLLPAYVHNFDLVLLSGVEPLRTNPMLRLGIEEVEEDAKLVLDKDVETDWKH